MGAEQPPTREEFSEATGHVRYEMDMLIGTNRLIPQKWETNAVQYALIESFLIHARNLIVFFADDRREKNNFPKDVWASDYEPTWKGSEGQKDAGKLRDMYKDRIDKTVAHLTTTRIQEALREWDFDGIRRSCIEVWDSFAVVLGGNSKWGEFTKPLPMVETNYGAVGNTSTSVFATHVKLWPSPNQDDKVDS